MATRTRSPKKNNSNLLALFIMCVSEHTRFSPLKDGPDVFDVKDLLRVVYAFDLPLYVVIDIYIHAKRINMVNLVDERIVLLPRGEVYRDLVKPTIIPPQTVAQP
jgi:hypothetical protein